MRLRWVIAGLVALCILGAYYLLPPGSARGAFMAAPVVVVAIMLLLGWAVLKRFKE